MWATKRPQPPGPDVAKPDGSRPVSGKTPLTPAGAINTSRGRRVAVVIGERRAEGVPSNSKGSGWQPLEGGDLWLTDACLAGRTFAPETLVNSRAVMLYRLQCLMLMLMAIFAARWQVARSEWKKRV